MTQQINLTFFIIFGHYYSSAFSIYCSVLFKWEFFIQMRASCLPLSFHQKRGATEGGWVQNRPFSFEWKTLIWIGRHCRNNVRTRKVTRNPPKNWWCTLWKMFFVISFNLRRTQKIPKYVHLVLLTLLKEATECSRHRSINRAMCPK